MEETFLKTKTCRVKCKIQKKNSILYENPFVSVNVEEKNVNILGKQFRLFTLTYKVSSFLSFHQQQQQQ